MQKWWKKKKKIHDKQNYKSLSTQINSENWHCHHIENLMASTPWRRKKKTKDKRINERSSVWMRRKEIDSDEKKNSTREKEKPWKTFIFFSRFKDLYGTLRSTFSFFYYSLITTSISVYVLSTLRLVVNSVRSVRGRRERERSTSGIIRDGGKPAGSCLPIHGTNKPAVWSQNRFYCTALHAWNLRRYSRQLCPTLSAVAARETRWEQRLLDASPLLLVDSCVCVCVYVAM